jgi:hypothetical protein
MAELSYGYPGLDASCILPAMRGLWKLSILLNTLPVKEKRQRRWTAMHSRHLSQGLVGRAPGWRANELFTATDKVMTEEG